MTVTHRMSSTREYAVWMHMRARCNRPNHPAYANYGGRGIRVCDEWNNPRGGFVRFFAHVGKRPKGQFDLDRIDNARGYEPGNVRWATRKANAQNKRNNRMITIGDRTKCLSEWAREAGLSVALVCYRLRSGWSAADAVGLGAGRGNALAAAERDYGATTIEANGKTLTIAEWAKEIGVKENTLRARLAKGWSPQEAVGRPLTTAGSALETRVCLQCKNEFRRRRSSKAVRCSVACFLASRMVERRCRHCARPFTLRASVASAGFCSRTCGASARRAA